MPPGAWKASTYIGAAHFSLPVWRAAGKAGSKVACLLGVTAVGRSQDGFVQLLFHANVHLKL